MPDKNIVYREDKKTVDAETGEVNFDSSRIIKKVPRTPDFIMLFTKHVAFLEHLNKAETTILFEILHKYVGVENLIFLSPGTKKAITKKLNVDNSYINRAIRGLRSKKIIVENDDKMNYLNPHLFGKGNWENINKMRQEIIYDFDFESLEFKEQRNTKILYENDLEEMPHKIIDEKNYIEDGVSTQEIVIQEDTPLKENTEGVISKEENIEVELQKEKNRGKELSIKELELKIKAQELGIL